MATTAKKPRPEKRDEMTDEERTARLIGEMIVKHHIVAFRIINPEKGPSGPVEAIVMRHVVGQDPWATHFMGITEGRAMFFWGHYFSSWPSAMKDFMTR